MKLLTGWFSSKTTESLCSYFSHRFKHWSLARVGRHTVSLISFAVIVFSLFSQNFTALISNGDSSVNKQSTADLNLLSSAPASLPNNDKIQDIKVSTRPLLLTLDNQELSYELADSETAIANFSQLLQTELSKYTPQFLKRTGLETIYLVKNLKVANQYRSAMPSVNDEMSIYFDISEKYLKDTDHVKETIHHEISHVMEYYIYGSFDWEDIDWYSCNSADFVYGGGAVEGYKNIDYSISKHPRQGFLNGYSTFGIEEDKAEIFANIMTEDDYMYGLTTSDAALDCKVKLYKSYIFAIDPKMYDLL